MSLENDVPKGHPHLFMDHQHCLKCGLWEMHEDADYVTCTKSDEQYDAEVRAKIAAAREVKP